MVLLSENERERKGETVFNAEFLGFSDSFVGCKGFVYIG